MLNWIQRWWNPAASVTGFCTSFDAGLLGGRYNLAVLLYTLDEVHANNLPLVTQLGCECHDKGSELGGFFKSQMDDVGFHPERRTQIPIPERFTRQIPFLLEGVFLQRGQCPALFEGREDLNTNLFPLEVTDAGLTVLHVSNQILTNRPFQRMKCFSPEAREVTAALIQVNRGMFNEGNRDQPGLVVFSTDDKVSTQQLQALGEGIGRLNREAPQNSDEQFLADVVARSQRMGMYGRRWELPKRYSKGHVIYIADLFFNRQFLPGGHLRDQRLFRCLAEPGVEGYIELLPQS